MSTTMLKPEQQITVTAKSPEGERPRMVAGIPKVFGNQAYIDLPDGRCAVLYLPNPSQGWVMHPN